VGWMRVTTHEDGALAVMSYTSVAPGLNPLQAIHAFEGVPAESAEQELFVPLFRSMQRGFEPGDRIDTAIAVVNPGDEPAEVSVTYYGTNNPQAAAACWGGVFQHELVTVPAMGSRWIEQRPGGGHDLPQDCFGSAVLRTASPDQRVVATVVDMTNGNQLLSSFSAVPISQASTRVALPLFRRAHYDLTTGIQVMNTGDVSATVSIAFVATDNVSDESQPIMGCDICVQVIAPKQGFDWWPGLIAAIPDFTFGAATVTSTVPVVVLVNDYPLKAQSDPATYLGIPALGY
jgi:hypothetical protein